MVIVVLILSCRVFAISLKMLKIDGSVTTDTACMLPVVSLNRDNT